MALSARIPLQFAAIRARCRTERGLTKLDARDARGGIGLRNAHARCTPRRLTHMRGLYLNWFPPRRSLVPSFGYNFIKRVIGFEYRASQPRAYDFGLPAAGAPAEAESINCIHRRVPFSH